VNLAPSSQIGGAKIPPGNLLICGSSLKFGRRWCCREVAIACRNTTSLVLVCTYTVRPICFVPYFWDIWVVLNPVPWQPYLLTSSARACECS
ncbi:hypothetical protein BDA96_09G140500, partial [Sorghum bicolor]